MTKLDDQRFTRKQADRILADAAERESRDYETDTGEGLTYGQIVQSAQEAGIDPKYLKKSAKDLIKEAGGLERAVVGRIYDKTKRFVSDMPAGFFGGYSTLLSQFRKMSDSKKNIEGALLSSALGAGVYGTTVALAMNGIPFLENAQPYVVVLASIATATQIGSGLYEWYRYERNNLVEEMNGEEKK